FRAQRRIDDMEGLLAALEAFFDEGQEHAILFSGIVEKRTDMTLCAKHRAGEPNRLVALTWGSPAKLGTIIGVIHQVLLLSVACAMRTKGSGRQGRRVHTEPLIRLPGTAAGARYNGVSQCHAFWFSGTSTA